MGAHIDYLEISLHSDAADIGRQACELLCSGPLKAYQRLQPLRRTLGPALTYLGSDCGATLDACFAAQ